MLRALLLFLVGLFFITPLCYGYSLFETENFVLSIDSYLRTDLATFKNTVDLDSANSDDTTTYLGIDYSLGFKGAFKNENLNFYLKLERNGPGDYNAPLFVHNTLINTGGVIEKYHNDELLPQIEEFWLDTPLSRLLRFKVGLYTYEVGNGFSLNGSYENYGFTIYRESEDFVWRIYYCRPGVVYKNRLGPRIRQEEEQDYRYYHNASNFFATDVKLNLDKGYIQPYIGALVDYTAPEKRDNDFAAAIKKDILGTSGFAINWKYNKLSMNLEMAHNFGKAESDDPNYKDVYHTGYFFFTDLDYDLGRFIPSLQFLLCSGNKATLDAALNEDEKLTSGKNRAFSYYSPLNKNLGNYISGCNADARPIVAMGGGYGLNYGVPRPKTFASGDFDNLIMPSLGLDFKMTEKLKVGIYGYYLRSFEKGVGTLNEEPKYLSKELGYESDLFIDYQLTEHILISVLGGYFYPGRYYKEERDDTTGSLFSPFVRGDGKADPAYQIELSVEFQF
jgi:hypothetical protein